MGGLVDIPLSRLTVARSGTATRVNASGLIETVAANTARLDYDPVTFFRRGLLVEEPRTNHVVRSVAFEDAAWIKANTSIVPGAAVAPDGSVSARKFAEGNPGAVVAHSLYQARTSANETVTFSVFARGVERSHLTIEFINFLDSSVAVTFDLSAGTAGVVTTGSPDITNGVASIVQFGGGWWRCALTARKGAANTTLAAILALSNGLTTAYAGTDGHGIYLWGAQLETGPYSSSYIPTDADPVSRGVDIVSMPLPEGVVTAGTALVEWSAQHEAPYNIYPLSLNGGWPDRLDIEVRPGLRRGVVVISGGVLEAEIFSGFGTAGAVYRNAVAWAQGSVTLADNGAIIGSEAALRPAITQMNVGSTQGVNAIGGHIRRVQLYPRRMTDAELQSLTA